MPVVSPYWPKLILTKSPDAVAQEEGDQSNNPKFPVVNPVDVDDTSSSCPVAKVFPLVERASRSPDVRVDEVIPNTDPVVVTSDTISATPPVAVSIPFSSKLRNTSRRSLVSPHKALTPFHSPIPPRPGLES